MERERRMPAEAAQSMPARSMPARSMPARVSRLGLASILAAALAGTLGLLPARGHAEEAAPEPVPAGRYTMWPAPGGFVRLDTQTGLVSQCRRETSGADSAWHCAAIPEGELTSPDRIMDRIMALAQRTDALAAEVAALAKQITGLANPPKLAEAAAAPPEAARVSFADEALRRIARLVGGTREPRPAGPATP